MSDAMTLDEMLANADEAGARAMPVAPSMTEEMQRIAKRGEEEGKRQAAAHFLYGMMTTNETLFDSKPDAGQLLDDAITHFLAALQAEIGKGYASNCAATLIRNIALFLDPGKRDRVLMALEIEGRNR